MSRAPASRAELESIFRAALEAVSPAGALRAAVRRDARGLSFSGRRVPEGSRLVVFAAGKAAAAMASALEEVAGDLVAGGLAVTKDGHGVPLRRVALREAGHPVPDPRGEQAARDALALVREARREDVLVALLSGGASALLACPLPGLDLDEIAATTRALLGSGASIDEINTLRKHLCELCGGRLARAARCHRIELLAISDVPGDRLDLIGSGLCTPDPSRYADALAVVASRGLRGRLPPRVLARLEAGARGELEESPKPGEPGFERVRAEVLASNRTALAAAQRAAQGCGLRVLRLGGMLRGEAREVGQRLGALAWALRPRAPLLLLAGGETTVTLRGDGSGGRCQELALAAALALRGHPGAQLLAAGSDGTDGPTDAAGAFADGATVARGAAAGVDAQAALGRNDSYGFFAAEGGLLRTGPTRTNVMDLVLLRLGPPAS